MPQMWDHEPQPYERGDRWGVIHSWITRAGLSHRAITAYVALCLHVDRAGIAWPSMQMMADEMSTSPSTIKRGIQELEERRIIIKETRRGGDARQRCRYWVRMQAPDGLTEARHYTDELDAPYVAPEDNQATVVIPDDAIGSQGPMSGPKITPADQPLGHGDQPLGHGDPVTFPSTLPKNKSVSLGDARAKSDPRVATTAPAEAVAPPQPDEAEIIDEAPDVADPLQALIPSSGGTRPSRALVPAGAPTKTSRRATRLPDDWRPSEALVAWTLREAPGLDHERELARFRDYWHSAAGARGRKASWDATWRNWVRRAVDDVRRYGGQPTRCPESVLPERLPIDHMTEDDWRDFAHYVNSSPDLLTLEAEERAQAQGALAPIPGIDPRGWVIQ